MNILEVNNLTFSYPFSSNNIFSNLSFCLKEGESLSILGKNGSGKTTLIKILTSLLKPTSGEILFKGKPLNSDISLHIQVVFQNPQDQFITASFNEEVRICSSFFKRDVSDIQCLVDKYSVNDLYYKEFNTLSGGEKQKLALILSLYSNCEVLIFDESLSSLDSNQRELFLNDILSLKQDGKSIIFITHDPNLALLFDKTLVLDILEFGKSEDILYKENSLYKPYYYTLYEKLKERGVLLPFIPRSLDSLREALDGYRTSKPLI